MEAYPFADDISLILSNYWKTPAEKRAELPGPEIIERIRELVETAFNANPEHAGFLKDFIAKQGDKGMISEFSGPPEIAHVSRPGTGEKPGSPCRSILAVPRIRIPLYNVKVEWGDSTVNGSTAQVTQDRKVEIDTIDPSKFIED